MKQIFLGSNDMTNIFDPKRKTEEEKFSEEKRSTTGNFQLKNFLTIKMKLISIWRKII